jgi:phosphonate transport system permease protein
VSLDVRQGAAEAPLAAPPTAPPQLSPPWDRRRIELTVLAAVAVIVAVVSIRRMDISPGRLVDGWDAMWRLFFGIDRPSGIWPPNFQDVGRIFELIVQTFFMAILATFIAAILSFPLGFLAARTTTPHPAVRYVARGIIAVARTIPELVFAAIFVRAFMIGPAAGVLALALHAIGMIAKLLADAIEETDLGQREGVAAVGAGWTQQMSTGVLPQVTPTYLAVCLYRLDINFRSSTILGLVGAGGIGELLNAYKGSLRWDLFMGVVVFIIVTVLLVEWLSMTGRKLILGHDNAGRRRKSTPLGRLGEHLGRPAAKADDFRPSAAARPVTRVADEHDAVVVPSLRQPWTPERARLAVFTAFCGLLVVVSLWASGVAWGNVFNGLRPQFGAPAPGELPTVWFIAQRLIPTDFGWFTADVRAAMLDTIAMGVAATVLGLPLALLLGYLGARNVAPNSVVYGSIRVLQVVLRAIPEVIVAILLVAAVGLGVFPGALALTIGVVAVGAKFFSDALEVVDEAPREGVRATGATRLQETATAVTPQFVPNLVGNSLYMLDIMVRASTVVGIFGAGGIGFYLFQASRVLDWEVLGGLLLMILVVVFAIERLSDWVRARLI